MKTKYKKVKDLVKRLQELDQNAYLAETTKGYYQVTRRLSYFSVRAETRKLTDVKREPSKDGYGTTGIVKEYGKKLNLVFVNIDGE